MEQAAAPTLRKSRRRNTVASVPQFEVLPCETDVALRGGVSEPAEPKSNGDAPSEGAAAAPSSRFSHIELRLEMWNLATGSSATSSSRHQPLGARPTRSRSSPIIAPPEALSSPAEAAIKKTTIPAEEVFENALEVAPEPSNHGRDAHPDAPRVTVEIAERSHLISGSKSPAPSPSGAPQRGAQGTRGSVSESGVETRGRGLSRWQSVPALTLTNAARSSGAVSESPMMRHGASPRWPISEASQPATASESVSPAVSSHGRRFLRHADLDRQTNGNRQGVAGPACVATPPARPPSAADSGVRLSRAASSEPTSNVFVWAAQQRIARHRSALQ
ncbi:hypothetical protein CLOM_g4260 [Closterium sp. NIES-68]|nr:hypothetical protein CLOM_g4260 [Closterium sp. NIES-68]GJP80136.1 hypothetical protein CLOP_g10362 [Closterium sp. NIES-67]